MISFSGNSILLIEGDRAYGIQLKEILREKGAIVTFVSKFSEARAHLEHSDVDLIVSVFGLPDGSLRSLVDWCQESLSTVPGFAGLGNCTQLERKQLEKLGVETFVSKADSSSLLDHLSRALFDFDDFKRSYLESRQEHGIAYELRVGKRVMVARALEITDKGVFLSFEAPVSFGQEAVLDLSCTREVKLGSKSFNGILQGEFSEGQFFKVNENELSGWNDFLSELQRKQGEVTDFLKKAAGK